MRKLTYFVGTTIDGFIADAADSIDAFFPLPDGLAEFLVAEYSETLPTHVHEPLGVTRVGERFDSVVMGQGTYEPGVAQGVTSPYTHLNQYVVSSSMTSPDPAVTVIDGDPLEAVRALKNEPGGGIWLAGGGRLAATLVSEIDELILKVYPFVLGCGTGVFNGAVDPARFTLAEVRPIGDGATVNTYTRT